MHCESGRVGSVVPPPPPPPLQQEPLPRWLWFLLRPWKWKEACWEEDSENNSNISNNNNSNSNSINKEKGCPSARMDRPPVLTHDSWSSLERDSNPNRPQVQDEGIRGSNPITTTTTCTTTTCTCTAPAPFMTPHSPTASTWSPHDRPPKNHPQPQPLEEDVPPLSSVSAPNNNDDNNDNDCSAMVWDASESPTSTLPPARLPPLAEQPQSSWSNPPAPLPYLETIDSSLDHAACPLHVVYIPTSTTTSTSTTTTTFGSKPLHWDLVDRRGSFETVLTESDDDDDEQEEEEEESVDHEPSSPMLSSKPPVLGLSARAVSLLDCRPPRPTRSSTTATATTTTTPTLATSRVPPPPPLLRTERDRAPTYSSVTTTCSSRHRRSKISVSPQSVRRIYNHNNNDNDNDTCIPTTVTTTSTTRVTMQHDDDNNNNKQAPVLSPPRCCRCRRRDASVPRRCRDNEEEEEEKKENDGGFYPCPVPPSPPPSIGLPLKEGLVQQPSWMHQWVDMSSSTTTTIPTPVMDVPLSQSQSVPPDAVPRQTIAPTSRHPAATDDDDDDDKSFVVRDNNYDDDDDDNSSPVVSPHSRGATACLYWCQHEGLRQGVCEAMAAGAGAVLVEGWVLFADESSNETRRVYLTVADGCSMLYLSDVNEKDKDSKWTLPQPLSSLSVHMEYRSKREGCSVVIKMEGMTVATIVPISNNYSDTRRKLDETAQHNAALHLSFVLDTWIRQHASATVHATCTVGQGKTTKYASWDEAQVCAVERRLLLALSATTKVRDSKTTV